MTAWPKVRLGEMVSPVARGETPFPGTTYRQVGVKLWGEGAYERESIDGAQTKYAQLFRTEDGDIIVNKIWARNGSVTVVSEFVKKPTALGISRSGGARNPHVFQYTLRFLRSGGTRPSFA
ncbi:MAG: hypothetical protein ACREYE_02775, partial [Gammaproteobacteria bacterium]